MSSLAACDAVRRACDDYLNWNRTLEGPIRAHWTQQGQVAWTTTALARHQREHLTTWIRSFPSGVQHHLKQLVTVTDLGAGDGQMTGALLHSLASIGLRPAAVSLIDQNHSALELGAQRLKGQLPNRTEIRAICAHIQDIDFEACQTGSQLIFASGALHELPRRSKHQLLNHLAMTTRYLMIVEFSSDHDSLPSGSDVLTMRALKFYDALMSDAFKSLSRKDYQATIGVFLLDELIDILLNDYHSRRNYHLTTDGWIDLLVASSFEVVSFDRLQSGDLTTSFIFSEKVKQ